MFNPRQLGVTTNMNISDDGVSSVSDFNSKSYFEQKKLEEKNNCVSDIDMILGSHKQDSEEDWTDEEDEEVNIVKNNVIKEEIKKVQINISEKTPMKNIMDIDKILGTNDDFFDEDFESDSSSRSFDKNRGNENKKINTDVILGSEENMNCNKLSLNNELGERSKESNITTEHNNHDLEIILRNQRDLCDDSGIVLQAAVGDEVETLLEESTPYNDIDTGYGSKHGYFDPKSNTDINSKAEIGSNYKLEIISEENITEECNSLKDNKDIEINDNINKMSNINITIDISEENKEATFYIDMPDYCIKSVSKKNEKEKDRDNLQMKTNNKENDMKYLKGNEKLSIEVGMFLCKDNHDNSEIQFKINSKDIISYRPEKDFVESSNENIFINNEEIMSENMIDNDDLEYYGDINESIKNETCKLKTKEFELNVKYNAPEVVIQADMSEVKHLNIERTINLDVDVKQEDVKSSEKVKRFDFRYQLPPLNFLWSSSKNDTEINDEYINDSTEEQKQDFKFQLPKIDFSSFNMPWSSEKKDLEMEDDIKSERYDFRYQLPKMESLSFSFPWSSIKTDNEIDEENSINDDKPIRYDFRYQLPKIERPSLNCPWSPDREVDIDSISGSSVDFGDTDLNDKSEKFDFRRFISKIELPSFNLPWSSEKIDVEIEDDNKPERYDFRYKLPKIETPTLNCPWQPLKKNVEIQSDCEVNDDDNSNDKPDRYDFRYQLPTFEFQLPNVAKLFSKNNKEIDIDINEEAHYELGNANLNNDSKSDRFDFKFQFPNIEPPSFAFPWSSSKPEAKIIIDDGKDVNFEADADDKPERFDFRFQLPKIEPPSFTFPWTSPKPDAEIDIENINCNGNFEGDGDDKPERFDFRFQLPKIEPPSFTFPWNSSNANNHANINAVPDSSYKCLLRPDLYSGSSAEMSDPLNKILSPIISEASFSAEDFSKHIQTPKLLKLQFLVQGNLKPSPGFTEQYSEILNDSEEEHSDIDLYPTPIRIVHLPFFHPLVSTTILARSNSCNSESAESSTIERDTNFKISTDHSTYTPKDYSINSEDESFSQNTQHNVIVNKPLSFEGHRQLDENKNSFCLLFEEKNPIKHNKFKVLLKKGQLICCECYRGIWQNSVNQKINFLSFDKDFRLIILPKNDKDVMVLLNADTIIDYSLKSSIHAYETLTIDGPVKLQEVTL